MKKRRYHITKEQARIILLALKYYTETEYNEINKIKDDEYRNYLTYNRIQAEIIIKELENYKWEIE